MGPAIDGDSGTMVESSRRHGKGSRSPTSGAGAAASSDAPPPERETGKMRIVDFLHEPHEGDDVPGDFGSPQRGDLFSIDSSGSPPRKFLPRWRLFPFRKPSLCSRGGETRPGSGHTVPSPHKKMKGRERGAEQEEDAKEKSKMAEGIDGRDCVRSLDPPAGPRKPEDVSFNLGMGIGMALALSRWSTEFNKMTELRVQMEMLLKEIKEEIPKKDTGFGIIRSNHNFVSSLSDCSRDVSEYNPISFQNHRADFHMEEAKSTVESDRHSNNELDNENQSMDQLEAELAFELGQLQLSLGGKDSMKLSEQERMELAHEEASTSESHEPSDENHNVHCGVPASELERRLYELICSRQEERIAELESALEFTRKRLVEKEIKVSWWKDTGMLASPSLQHEEEMLSVNLCDSERERERT
ncbi:protein POLAR LOCALIZATION DURING ASYMMETRIC DIVISION AND REDISTRIBUTION-like isoform X1 [Musa acuminata AAA Group]|uniref:protein POLAR LOCALIZATION DURING ASYMMETRIC DIVISION AND REDISTRIBUTION-like isoform X1 n=2 Tax=Musa acuminata AAA Group TaxID=214697 RepID=UPI0031E47068